jgi:hypothetical protein
MTLCGGKSPFDFGDSCVRASWSALVPGAFVFALCVFSIPLPALVCRPFEPLTRQFRWYLTLPESEALNEQGLSGEKIVEEVEGAAVKTSPSVPVWRTLVFVFVGVMETLYWLAFGSYLLYDDASNWWRGAGAVIYSIAWLYTVIRPVARPSTTPPLDSFVIYLLLLFSGILELGGYLYDHSVYDVPLPSQAILAAIIANIVATIALLAIMGGMPLAIPSDRVKKEDIVSLLSCHPYTCTYT